MRMLQGQSHRTGATADLGRFPRGPRGSEPASFLFLFQTGPVPAFGPRGQTIQQPFVLVPETEAEDAEEDEIIPA